MIRARVASFVCTLALVSAAGGVRAADKTAPQANARCEKCHQEIASEWQSSRHHQSFGNDEFQRALAREGKSEFCVACHAPEAKKRGAPTPAEARLGVGCASCHATPHGVLAAPSDAETVAPHAVTRSADLLSSQLCKNCHEFRFETPRIGAPSEKAQWMQRTWSEHHDGKSDVGGCSSCHMPRVASTDGGTHASHRFLGGHDEAFVQSALAIEARRTSASTVEIELTPRDVTHAVPTGDLFRRLQLAAEAGGQRTVRYLARHHERTRHDQRVETNDDRPRFGTSRVTLDLGNAAASDAISVRVVYQRVDYLVGDDEEKAHVSGQIPLFEQRLPALATTSAPPSASPPKSTRSWAWLSALLVPLLTAFGLRRPRTQVAPF